MPSNWIDDHVGDEGTPRPGFEDELAAELRREWRGAANPRWRLALWGAAAAPLLVGVIVVATRDGDRTVTPVDTTVPATDVTSSIDDTVVEITEPSTRDTPETLPDPDPDGAGIAAVIDYLDALAQGDYVAAAELLGRGGLDWESRPDIRPLYRPEYGLVPGQSSTEALASALERWCARSICVTFASVGEWGFGQMRATFVVNGVERSSMFVGYLDEGQPAVQGLPLQSPPVGELDLVPCPDDGMMRQTWADLDGDGWMEQLIVRRLADEATNILVVCGTTLRVEEFEFVDGEGLWVYPVNPALTGPDLLLLGSVPPFPAGSVYRLEGGRLEATEGTFGFITPMVDQPGRSTGCRDLDDDGVMELVNNTYRYLGGTDLSNSTQLMVDVTPAFGGATERITFDLPAETDAAFDIINGTCHGLPVMTG
jgi:hypothetical protein